MKVMVICGTRPEWIKMASTIRALQKHKDIELVVVNTGQHKELSEQIIKLFKLPVNYNLKIMKKNQSLCDIVKNAIGNLGKIIENEKPYLVLVHGDTTTSLTGALATFYNKTLLMHIEAGARSFNKNLPFPEEANRQLIARIADYHICTCEGHRKNLEKENIKSIISGDPDMDALMMLPHITPCKKEQILITMHRRENWGAPIYDVCTAILELANLYSNYKFIISCHPNPKVKNIVKSVIEDNPIQQKNIEVHTAMPYDKFIKTMVESKLIITDSGGIPQEAATFKIPVLITRDFFENKEMLNLNLAKVVGTKCDNVVSNVIKLLDNNKEYEKMREAKSPYGDGNAYKIIIKEIEKILRGEQ